MNKKIADGELAFYRRYSGDAGRVEHKTGRMWIVERIHTRPETLQAEMKAWHDRNAGQTMSSFDFMVKDVLYLMTKDKPDVAGSSARRRQDLDPRECMALRNYLVMMLERDKDLFLQQNYSSVTELAKAACWLSVAISTR
jgi:hypothetical protein